MRERDVARGPDKGLWSPECERVVHPGTAFYTGADAASAQSYVGAFYGPSGGVLVTTGSIFWGGGWYGGSAGLSLGAGSPVTASWNPTYYVMIAGPVDVSKVSQYLCYAIIAAH